MKTKIGGHYFAPILSSPSARLLGAAVILLLCQLAAAAQPATPHEYEIDENAVSDFIYENSSYPPPGFEPQAFFRHVRMVYLVPADKFARDEYRAGIGNAILSVQHFYQRELGGAYAFTTHTPLVEVRSLPSTSAFYGSPSSDSSFFWRTVLRDAFAVTGGRFNDPNNRWIFYIDADEACGQGVGGTQGVALMPANDLRGLNNEPRIARCPGQQPDMSGYNRWVGGLGHELGHAFNLPHPPGCDPDGVNCFGGAHARNSLMYFGYASYPITHLLAEDKNSLLGSGFFTQFNLLDDIHFFVRQQYIDFLSREPEWGGFNAWTGVLRNCPNPNGDPACDRITVSSSFFRSAEFHGKGYFFYRFYTTALGRRPTHAEFRSDVGLYSAQTSAQVEPKKQEFIADFTNRPTFRSIYDGLSNAAYVDRLLSTAGVFLPYRDEMVNDLNTGARTRGQVLRRIAESPEVESKEYNGAFVTMEYFGYLLRDPEEPGYTNWLTYLNNNPGDFRTMVNGFLNSHEHRSRFGPP